MPPSARLTPSLHGLGIQRPHNLTRRAVRTSLPHPFRRRRVTAKARHARSSRPSKIEVMSCDDFCADEPHSTLLDCSEFTTSHHTIFDPDLRPAWLHNAIAAARLSAVHLSRQMLHGPRRCAGKVASQRPLRLRQHIVCSFAGLTHHRREPVRSATVHAVRSPLRGGLRTDDEVRQCAVAARPRASVAPGGPQTHAPALQLPKSGAARRPLRGVRLRAPGSKTVSAPSAQSLAPAFLRNGTRSARASRRPSRKRVPSLTRAPIARAVT
jgi:hypothetical protein